MNGEKHTTNFEELQARFFPLYGKICEGDRWKRTYN